MSRKFVPKPKERRKVTIPQELHDSLREVFELIEEAKNDPDSLLDYDDAIQTEAVCGGRRRGEERRPYVFTFYPEGQHKRGNWYLSLDETEIEDIGDGHMTEILMYCCTSPECDRKFREENDSCIDCDYVNEE
ncbi:hypothetical protein Pla110_07830 [Polystyrenella longa]|uniref:Uncharacterized protein n=1 Tax=Polystyrenella longa TaxID=2528007 RepID=A0A518CIM1_9PLAN|nr:hypothetical protein [Polystyrenella longa]QDU79079.1 hypothetical protein Pla110_07830 [Polystyrenella longa]